VNCCGKGAEEVDSLQSKVESEKRETTKRGVGVETIGVFPSLRTRFALRISRLRRDEGASAHSGAEARPVQDPRTESRDAAPGIRHDRTPRKESQRQAYFETRGDAAPGA